MIHNTQRESKFNGETEKLDEASRWYVPAVLDDDSEMTPVQFRVLASLCRRAGKKDYCWPGIDDIAGRCHIKRETAQRALKELQRRGYIRIEPRPGDTSNYHIALFARYPSKGDTPKEGLGGEVFEPYTPSGKRGLAVSPTEGGRRIEKEGIEMKGIKEKGGLRPPAWDDLSSTEKQNIGLAANDNSTLAKALYEAWLRRKDKHSDSFDNRQMALNDAEQFVEKRTRERQTALKPKLKKVMISGRSEPAEVDMEEMFDGKKRYRECNSTCVFNGLPEVFDDKS